MACFKIPSNSCLGLPRGPSLFFSWGGECTNFSHMWHIPCPPLSPRLCNMKNAKWRACIMMLIIRFCFPSPLLSSSNLEHPQPMLPPPQEEPSFIPTWNNTQNYSFVYSNLYIFIHHMWRQFWTEWKQEFLKFNPQFTLLHSIDSV